MNKSQTYSKITKFEYFKKTKAPNLFIFGIKNLPEYCAAFSNLLNFRLIKDKRITTKANKPRLYHAIFSILTL